MAREVGKHDGLGNSAGRKFIYLLWSGTTARGDERVVGYAQDMAEALQAMAMIAPEVSAARDEIRRDWPFPGATEILRAWYDKKAGASRWLRATPTPHALDQPAPEIKLLGRSQAIAVGSD